MISQAQADRLVAILADEYDSNPVYRAAVDAYAARRCGSSAPSPLTTVCATCKRVRGTDGIWRNQTADEAAEILALRATHGICDECLDATEYPAAKAASSTTTPRAAQAQRISRPVAPSAGRAPSGAPARRTS